MHFRSKIALNVGVIVPLFLVSGCSYKKVKPDKEVCFIKENVQHVFDQEVSWGSSSVIENLSDHAIKKGLLREESIGIALNNSSDLQVKFRDLGIAKADLEKVGLYKNPYLNTIIQFPKPNPFRANNYVEVDLTWNFADLWLVPRRKKISSDQLEIATFDIIDTIFDIRSSTSIAYNKCVYAIAQLKNAQETLEALQSLHHAIQAKNQKKDHDDIQSQGKKNDQSVLDDHLMLVLINQMNILVANALLAQRSAFLEFTNMININMTDEPILLYDELIALDPSSITYDLPEDNPKLIKARLKIQQEKNKKTLEKVRFADDFAVGFSYNNQPIKNGVEIAGPRLFGPTIGMSLPIFDNNYANVARAEFLIQKAENEYISLKSSLSGKVALYKAEIETACTVISHYQKIVLSYEKIVQHEERNEKMAKLKRVSGLNTHVELFNKKSELLKAYLTLYNNIALLEQIVGRKVII